MTALQLHGFFAWKYERVSLESRTVLLNTDAFFLTYALGLQHFSSHISWNCSTRPSPLSSLHMVQRGARGETPQGEVRRYDPPTPSTALPLSGVPAEVTLLIFESLISSPHEQHRLPKNGCRRKLTVAGSVLSQTCCKTRVLTQPNLMKGKQEQNSNFREGQPTTTGVSAVFKDLICRSYRGREERKNE